MTAWRVARIAVRVLMAVVLLVSGTYLLLYLYRWEWNRAIVSGLFFLSALVTASTALVLGAIRRLDERVDELAGGPPDAADTRRRIGEANAEHARRHFAWLRDSPTRTSVFIPVLLGAGALLSGISYLLERMAGAMAGATIDRRSARLLDPDLPLGPTRPLPRSARVPAPAVDPLLSRASEPATRTRTSQVVAVVASIVVAGLLVGGGVSVLRDASQSRPEPGTTDGATALVLEISQRRTPRPVVTVAEALWITCRSRLRQDTQLTSARQVDERTVRLVVSQGMGPLRQRRFVGCLQDASIDLVQARVLATEHLP